MSSSAANPTTTTNSIQASTQGASAEKSPTLTAGGDIQFENLDSEVALAAMEGARDIINSAINSSLNKVSELAGSQVAASQVQNQQAAQQLSEVLSKNSDLASTKLTGTDTATMKYLIYGIIGIAIVGVLAFAFGKRT